MLANTDKNEAGAYHTTTLSAAQNMHVAWLEEVLNAALQGPPVNRTYERKENRYSQIELYKRPLSALVKTPNCSCNSQEKSKGRCKGAA
jgi:hypothetical protein